MLTSRSSNAKAMCRPIVEMPTVGFIDDPIFDNHRTGSHPENAGRLAAIRMAIATSESREALVPLTYRPATEDELALAHSPQHIARIRQIADHGGAWVDGDTVVTEASYDVAVHAVGAATRAVEAVVTGEQPTALAIVRPPGHHATPTRAMGFCLFNNAAIAALVARERFAVERTLLIDFDVHHGNGTQDIFYADDGVFFLSIHRYPFYPGTGSADETGTGRGLGYTLNIPVRFGTPRQEYHRLFLQGLERAASISRPELVLISAGFDAHREDPIGSLGLEVEDFAELTRWVQEVAEVHAQGRVVSCLEGGYHLDRLAECVEVHLRQLAGENVT